MFYFCPSVITDKGENWKLMSVHITLQNTSTPEPLSKIVSCICSGVKASATVLYPTLLDTIGHVSHFVRHMSDRTLVSDFPFLPLGIPEWRCFVVWYVKYRHTFMFNTLKPVINFLNFFMLTIQTKIILTFLVQLFYYMEIWNTLKTGFWHLWIMWNVFAHCLIRLLHQAEVHFRLTFCK